MCKHVKVVYGARVNAPQRVSAGGTDAFPIRRSRGQDDNDSMSKHMVLAWL